MINQPKIICFLHLLFHFGKMGSKLVIVTNNNQHDTPYLPLSITIFLRSFIFIGQIIFELIIQILGVINYWNGYLHFDGSAG